MDDWSVNCEIGQRGIDVALPVLSLIGRPVVLNGDQAAILAIQKLGIDVIVDRDDIPLCVEVKAELTTSPNIFLEITQNRFIRNSPGWFCTIKSPLLVWTFLDNYHGYIVNTYPLLEWVSNTKQHIPERNGKRSVGLTPSWASITSNIGPENIQHWHVMDTDHELQTKLQTMNLI